MVAELHVVAKEHFEKASKHYMHFADMTENALTDTIEELNPPPTAILDLTWYQ